MKGYYGVNKAEKRIVLYVPFSFVSSLFNNDLGVYHNPNLLENLTIKMIAGKERLQQMLRVDYLFEVHVQRKLVSKFNRMTQSGRDRGAWLVAREIFHEVSQTVSSGLEGLGLDDYDEESEEDYGN